MPAKKFYLYVSVFCIHALIAFIAFHPFFMHPGSIVLSQWDDGMKNMFTLLSYVKEPLTTEGIMKYNSFCYPFGDYVFYTDNTPLFSVPFRWFCTHIVDLSKYTIPIFQLVVISNIVGCGLLVLYIFRQLLKEDTIAFILAIILPWTNVQILRILRGHFNLSFSVFILLAICLLLLWHKYKGDTRKQLFIVVAMILLSFISFLAHVYYLPIITIFIAASLFIYGLLTFKERAGKIAMAVSVIYTTLSVAVSFLVLYSTDSFFALRSVSANGYDWMEQKMRFSYLFNHYYFQKIHIPFLINGEPGQVDKPGYLGNMGLLAFIVLVMAALFAKKFRKVMATIQRSFFKDPLKASMLLGSIIMLMISFGEVYYTATPPEKGFKIINILNPFLYVHMLTDRVEQFRFLERFMWPFYFGFYIWAMFTLTETYKLSGKVLKVIIVTGMLFFGGTEVYAFVKEINRQTIMENNLNPDYVKKFVPKNVDMHEFQAVLPIPYYFTGAEDSVYDYNIDGDPDWVLQTYSISAGTGLPLMSSNMSRTPRIFGMRLLNFVANDSMDQQLGQLLNNKAILVAVNKYQVNNPNLRVLPTNKLDADLYWKAIRFTIRNQLSAFDSIDNIVFYKWYPAGK